MSIELETHFIEFSTKGRTHIVDITGKVADEIKKAGFVEGQVTIFGIGSTTGISTIEYEPGLVQSDVPALYDQLAPYGVPYEHNHTWGDDNGAAHVRSTLTGSSLVVPFKNASLLVGTWQQIIFIDFDTRPRSRKVAVQIMGKKS
jgi:secondary thiamine-phosphate synthase enzyme